MNNKKRSNSRQGRVLSRCRPDIRSPAMPNFSPGARVDMGQVESWFMPAEPRTRMGVYLPLLT
jgi:hypothetical protein